MATDNVGIPGVTLKEHNLLCFASEVDDNVLGQARQLAGLPFIFPHVALMPDAHFGKGSSVGTVFGTEKAVIPAAVGVDIGCGMIGVRTSFTAADLVDHDLVDLRDAIERTIPLSPGRYNGRVLGGTAEAHTRELSELAERTGVDLGH
jgi:tRNA-splicing ligase RtcB